MIKLFVDDLRPAPEGWELARTISKAIRILDTLQVSEVSLDHDIASSLSIREPETFEPVARFIVRIYGGFIPGIHKPKVTLHTGSPSGAQKLKAILADAGIDSIIAPKL